MSGVRNLRSVETVIFEGFKNTVCTEKSEEIALEEEEGKK